MFINGIIRNDSNNEFSAVQEYCVANLDTGGSGRCDGFIEFNKNVILIEAKKQQFKWLINSEYFNLEKWLLWDRDEIQVQLKNYLASEKYFFLEEGRYNNCYLMTVVFKIVKENKANHITKAKRNCLLMKLFLIEFGIIQLVFLRMIQMKVRLE